MLRSPGVSLLRCVPGAVCRWPLAAAAGHGCPKAHGVRAGPPRCRFPGGRPACRSRGEPLCRGGFPGGIFAMPGLFPHAAHALKRATYAQVRHLANVPQQRETHAAPPPIPRQVAPLDFDHTPLVRLPPCPGALTGVTPAQAAPDDSDDGFAAHWELAKAHLLCCLDQSSARPAVASLRRLMRAMAVPVCSWQPFGAACMGTSASTAAAGSYGPAPSTCVRALQCGTDDIGNPLAAGCKGAFGSTAAEGAHKDVLSTRVHAPVRSMPMCWVISRAWGFS